jgi:hypothetical protein
VVHDFDKLMHDRLHAIPSEQLFESMICYRHSGVASKYRVMHGCNQLLLNPSVIANAEPRFILEQGIVKCKMWH